MEIGGGEDFLVVDAVVLQKVDYSAAVREVGLSCVFPGLAFVGVAAEVEGSAKEVAHRFSLAFLMRFAITSSGT
jgi:hypothetical protein